MYQIHETETKILILRSKNIKLLKISSSRKAIAESLALFLLTKFTDILFWTFGYVPPFQNDLIALIQNNLVMYIVVLKENFLQY